MENNSFLAHQQPQRFKKRKLTEFERGIEGQSYEEDMVDFICSSDEDGSQDKSDSSQRASSEQSEGLVAVPKVIHSSTPTEAATPKTDAKTRIKETMTAEELAEYEEVKNKFYKSLNKELEENMKGLVKLAQESASKIEPINIASFLALAKRSQVVQKACNIKYITATEKKPKQWAEQGPHPMTVEEVNSRFRGPEETEHPWIVTKPSRAERPPGGLLMRVEDSKSMARIYPDDGVLSQGSPIDLSTYAARKSGITKHLNWRNREPTAFISTTDSISDFREKRISHMLKRDRKSQTNTIKLIFINAIKRADEGWTTLKAMKVMKIYAIETWLTKDSPWFYHEYLLPFRVSPTQIIATYCWPVVEKYMRDNDCSFYTWFTTVVEPAFREHEAARKEGRPVRSKAGCVCCGH